jgi:hypothetical protein
MTSRNPPRTGTSPSSPAHDEDYPTTRVRHQPPPARRSMKTLLRTASRRRSRSHPRSMADPWPRAQDRVRPASAAIRLGHIHQFVSPRQSTPPQNSTRKHRPREPGLLRMPEIRDQMPEIRSVV